MTPVEHSYLRNMLEQNSQSHSFHTLSLALNGNGVPQNKKPMLYIMQSQNGIIIFRELK